jgi:general stress protein YciG
VRPVPAEWITFSTRKLATVGRTENLFLSSLPSDIYANLVAHRLQPECLNTLSIQEGHVAKEDRGFASMDRSKQRDIASKGGKAAHQKGTAHEWTSEEAREAGRKGGMASHRRKQEQQQTPDGSASGGSTPESEVDSTPNPEQMMGIDHLP